ncbi:MAG: S-layer homology domain-containing protein, partial [Clostridia bacterium]|nr:S-layer homology domain-containing protein [Clostridia bacterium]
LKEAGQGYLTVGVTGINDSGMTHGTDIVIKKINTKTPSTWKGEPACYHTEKEWVVTKEPDCGYEGVDSYTCKACGKVFETKAIPTVGEHNPVGEWTVAVDPNCANEGKEVNLCTKCGLPAEEKVIPADPEKHSKGWYTTFPTCEEVGIKKRYCLICGIMFPEENLILDPIGHAFTNYIIDSNATCIEDGTKTAKCDRCDATDVITESAYGHIEGEWETVKQTSCTESGKKILKCKVCNIVLKTENIPNIASHSFTIYKYNNDATCLKDGTKTAYCDNGCGTTDTVTAAGTSTGKHNYKESVLTEATCENEGIMLYLCECGNNYTKSISKAHKEKWMVVVEPTATQEGKEIKYCTVCTVVLETKTLPKKNSTVFIDVPLNTWYAEGVSYCSEKGYITGIGNNKFNPNGKLTREQFVVILARVAGAELSDYKSTEFNDVDVNSWYGPSVIWANKEGYVNGVGDGTKFGVSQEMTREQLATMFYRYAEKNSVNVDAKANLTEFIDASSVSNWATDACAWAIGAGLLGSTDSSKKVLSPQMTVTRAQAAKIFMSYDNIK